ncbi:MMPL family transporter [Parahaliea sp. F7430]|uniref:MMPL family transporter n=1 Tax=Sediminihaliea albiluteola TaxID=2758564 RepID=A0A7W2TW97_9GAMM|nr:MMPL family transporter [Sediminihaliea albiluteola]MBA6413081.1 MMPL family transporter [Sediminihaliea albiluteola]
MSHSLMNLFERAVLKRPVLSLVIVAVLLLAAGSQLSKIKLDASADSLMLQGDPALDFFREVSSEYSAEDFLLITWQPEAALLSDASLDPLKRMADELRELDGVSSVLTVWDVPLLESPPVTLSEITSSDPLPSLRDAGVDRDLALKEFTSSPIYSELLVSRDGKLTAVQINLQRDEHYFDLLAQREALRLARSRDGLSATEEAELEQVEIAFKAYTAVMLERQTKLVAQVREISDRYRQYAQLFVGGVPMITADMVSFVRSDLALFGSAILGVMILVLAVIFRRVRWVVIPLLTCSASVTVMLGILGLFDWRMTVISSNFVAVLLIVSLAIAIHLIVRFRELQAKDPSGEVYQLVRETVAQMAVPCAYTGITTIVAFMSLVVSGIKPVIDFGWMMTVGVMVALLLAFIMVPCMILVWPKGRPMRYAAEGKPMTLYFAAAADRYRRSIIVGTLALCALVLVGISQLKVENRFIDYFKDTTEIYQGMELLDSRLGGTIPLDIVLTAPDETAPLPGLEQQGSAEDAPPLAADDPFLEESEEFAFSADEFGADDGFADDDWGDDFASDSFDFGAPAGASFKPSYWFTQAGMQHVDAAHRLVDAQEETGKVLSLSTTFAVVKKLMGDDIGSVELALVQKSLPEDISALMVDPYFSADKEQARITVRVMETSETLRRDAFLKHLHSELVKTLGVAPEQVQFTGMLVLYNNVLQSLFKSQILTLGAVFVAILLMFIVLFRSFSLAIFALAPNILAACLVLGSMGLLGIPLDIMTITIAAIVVGMGVDDCIHYVYRYKREFALDRNYREAMYRSHGSIGRGMFYTTVTVIIGFAMLTLSNFNPSIYFGLLTVLAMASAVIGALLLLPLLIVLFKPLGPEQ